MRSLLRDALGLRRPRSEPSDDETVFAPHVTKRTFTVFGPQDDESVLGQIRQTGEYEPHVVGLIARVIASDAIVLDIGANVGALALVFADLAANGRVFAFEASTLSYELLQRAIRRNGASNIEAVHRAVFNESGLSLTFTTTSSFLAGSHLGSETANEGTVDRVETVTIDDWVRTRHLARVDVVKIDIEGSELSALSGARETLSRFAPDLLIECNAIVMRRFRSGSATELFDVLSRYYPRVYAIPDSFRDGTVVPLASAAELNALLVYGRGNEDLFCTRSPRSDLRVLPFEQFCEQVRASVGGREIALEPDFQLVPRTDGIRGPCGAIVRIIVELRNAGPQTLSSADPHPIHASYHVRSASGEIVVLDGVRTTLPMPVRPGQAVELEMTVQLPDRPGTYMADLTLVQEGIAWLEQLHVPVVPVAMTAEEP